MQVVIDIPKQKYDRILKQMKLDRNFRGCKIIELPKEHGRLVDADDLCITTVPGLDEEDEPFRYVSAFNLELARTIIEADKEIK